MPPSDTGTKTLETHQPCIRCSYDLYGLPLSGSCPECGLSVERSLRGDLLQFSDDTYRAALLRGVTLIMTGIIVSLVFSIIGVAVVIAMPSTNTEAALTLVGIIGTAISLVGYYSYSVADPGQLATNKGESPRRLIRIAIVLVAVGVLGQAGLTLAAAMTPPAAPNAPGFGVNTGLGGLAAIAWILGLLAGVVQFFAAMMYTKWLAPRIPSAKVFKRAKLLMWLGPVLYVFGCGIGQLIALVLYYNMFSWIRKALITIRDEGEYFDDPTKILN